MPLLLLLFLHRKTDLQAVFHSTARYAETFYEFLKVDKRQTRGKRVIRKFDDQLVMKSFGFVSVIAIIFLKKTPSFIY